MKVIEHWKTVLWRSATTWASVIVGTVLGVVGQGAMVALGIIGFLPAEMQLPAAILVGIMFTLSVIVPARLLRQPKLTAKIEAKQQEAVDAS